MAAPSHTDAVVVGSGPNGLAAAAVLARAGLGVAVYEAADEIGGGTRSHERLETGVLHDICSAVHPLGAGSPIFRDLGLEQHGLTWRWADIELAHPLDDRRAAILQRSIDATADGLGDDGEAWRSAFGPLAESFDALATDVLRPVIGVPRHPILLARFGAQALQSAELFARRWTSDEARALYAGIAAHAIEPLDRPLTAGVGAVLGTAGHAFGWPVAEGGSSAIAAALASVIAAHGGTVHTGVRVDSLDDLPPADIALLDVSPHAAIDIAGDRVGTFARRALNRWRYGPAAFKIDLIVEDGIPWAAPACRHAGTVHCGGTLEEIARGESALHQGWMPESPFVLVAQQYLADPNRSNGDRHPIWAYAHVPHRYTGDATEAVLAQIERFAPGFRDRIVAIDATAPLDLEAYNANYVGGDIATGANTPRQTVVRPRLAIDPYRLGDGVFLCSAATPPGAGVHGMCGFHAANSALRSLGKPAVSI